MNNFTLFKYKLYFTEWLDVFYLTTHNEVKYKEIINLVLCS